MIDIKNNSIARIKAIEKKNRERLLKLNPDLDDNSGVYFFIRKSEQNENEVYVGQALHICQRCCQHLTGYQYIDLSIKAHGLYSEDNPHGYTIKFLHFQKEQLDEKEQYYIKLYSEKGWILKNKTAGGQHSGKNKIGEYKQSKGYRDGVKYGRKTIAKEIKHIVDTHLNVTLKPEKEGNKISQKALEKFWNLIGESEE